MMVSVTALALAMSAQGMSIDDARKAYNNCLSGFTNDSLDTKLPESQFKVRVEEACAGPRAAMRKAIVADEVKYGSSKAEAEAYADEEIDIVIANLSAPYKAYMDSGQRWMVE